MWPRRRRARPGASETTPRDSQRAKTDAIDAQVLAHMARLAVEETPPWEPVEEDVADLRALVERRPVLLEQRDGEKERLRFTRDIIRPDIEASVATLEAQLTELDARIDDLVAASPRAAADIEVLESVRGVGRVTATTLRVLVPEARHTDPPRGSGPRRRRSRQPGLRHPERPQVHPGRSQGCAPMPLHGCPGGRSVERPQQPGEEPPPGTDGCGPSDLLIKTVAQGLWIHCFRSGISRAASAASSVAGSPCAVSRSAWMSLMNRCPRACAIHASRKS